MILNRRNCCQGEGDGDKDVRFIWEEPVLENEGFASTNWNISNG